MVTVSEKETPWPVMSLPSEVVHVSSGVSDSPGFLLAVHVMANGEPTVIPEPVTLVDTSNDEGGTLEGGKENREEGI